ncbi:MAG: SPOR domain-containing protein [Gemmatimonadota bacterium]
MHHISLDESFWRSAAEALASGDPLEDVEPSLLDVSRLLQRIHEAAERRPGGWLALLTLGAGEGERVAGLVLAALLSRRGRRILLVDLAFGDDTWVRLLGAEELDGIVDHVAYGVAPAKLVRPTSWDCLSLLPAGTAALHPPAILRSDKLRTCIETLGAEHDSVCLGLSFEEAVRWGSGGTASVDRAVLIGPRGDELGFEHAIPRLLQQGIDVLATLDVPPPGRWRQALGAALPALPTGRVSSATASPAGEDGDVVAAAPEDGPGGELPLFDSGWKRPAALAADPEVAADVAFLAGSGSGGDRREQPGGGRGRREDPIASRGSAPASGSGQGRLQLDEAESSGLRELASGWGAGCSGGPAATAEHEAGEGEGRWVMTLGAVVLCLLLGAGAFWYWRSNQQIPEGQFTFVEATGSGALQAAGSAQEDVTNAEEPGLTGWQAGANAAEEDESGPEGQAGSGEDLAGVEPAGAESGETAAPEVLPEDAEAGSEGRVTEGDTPAGEAAVDPAADESAVTPPEEGAAGEPGAGMDPPTTGPVLGFSLHVGSYQTYDAARGAAGELQRGGHTAFVVPVLLEGKGQWYRVFVGATADGASSQAELARALQQGVVTEGTVRETPWALYLGTYPTTAAAAGALEVLQRSGVSAYAVGSGPVTLYAGAYETAADAELLNRQLRDRGFDAALVRRRAAEAS